MCKLLVENGANVDHVDNRKQTALHFARKCKRDEVADFLIQKGSTPIREPRQPIERQKSQRLTESIYSSSKAKNKKQEKEKSKTGYKLVFASDQMDIQDC